MTDATMICGDVDERLPEYLEETLDERTRRRVQTHIASCVRCSALIAELDAIRTEASQLPELTPSRDLWAGIADRIETPVIALGSQPVWAGRRSPAWLIGAIAAGLVLATAGITHVLTRQSVERAFASRTPADAPATVPAASGEPGTPVRDDSVRRQAVAAAPSVREEAEPTRESVRRPQAPATQLVASSGADAAFDREIVRLREVLRQRRAQLDPETVVVIEQSLRVIDEAIAQSREALAKDPASRFLRDRLDHSLEKKVDLLRTAAMLPART